MKRRRQKALPPVKVGRVSIPRYQLGDGRVMIAYPTATKKRHLQTFADPKEAAAEADRIARELHNGGSEAQIFTASDRASFSQAKRDVAPHGVAVHVATAQWAEAKRAINGSRHTVAEVIGAGLKALSRTIHPLPSVAAELLAAKDQRDLHGRYRRGLENTLQRLSARFPGDIAGVRAVELEHFLTALDVGPRRRDNILGEIRHLFKFARSRSYLPDVITEAAKVGKLDHLSGTIEIFAPAEIQLFLEHVKPEWRPYLAIAAFSGIRAEEICLAKDAAKRKDPLRWEDFDWDEGEICVRAETAKTGHPRRCPILDNLAAWLRPWRDASGPVCTLHRPDREIGGDGRLIRAIRRALTEDLSKPLRKIEWRHNALRHSYGSYRMAMIKDMQRLSYEMGNSLAMIKRHYHNPRPVSEAKAYFALSPTAPDNVIELPLKFC